MALTVDVVGGQVGPAGQYRGEEKQKQKKDRVVVFGGCRWQTWQ